MNKERKLAMAGRIQKAMGGSVDGKTIAVLGVTFKPNTDDMREAPSLAVVPMLQERGAMVRAYDPQGIANAQDLLPGVAWCDGALSAVEDADATVVLTEWNEFRALDLDLLRRSMRGNVLVDLRNIYSSDLAEGAGLAYSSVGR